MLLNGKTAELIWQSKRIAARIQPAMCFLSVTNGELVAM